MQIYLHRLTTEIDGKSYCSASLQLLCLHQKRKLENGVDNELLNFQNVPETMLGTLNLIHVRLKIFRNLP